MTPRDFSGNEFVVASVHGIRAWNISPDGKLRGVTRPYEYHEGINHAECRRIFHTNECHEEQSQGWVNGGPLGFIGGFQAWAQIVVGGRYCECAMGCDDLIDPDCGCGFWAYWRGQSFGFGGQVAGVIEGSGLVTEGTKGFRCEKARIVAIVIPKPQPKPEFVPRDYNRRERLALWTYHHGPRMSSLWDKGRLLQIAEDQARVRHAFNASRDGIQPGHAEISPHRAEQIRDQYPNVPVYASIDAMLADFPVDDPPEVSDDNAH